MTDKEKLAIAVKALEYYCHKAEVSNLPDGRRVTRFVPRTDGTDFMAQQALKLMGETTDGE